MRPPRPLRAARLFSYLIIAAAVLFPERASRAEEKIDCENAMTTADMNTCAGRDFAKEDAALNEAYRKAIAAIPEMASADPPFDAKSWEEALRASQRAWVAYRDAECEDHVAMFWSGGSGGTVEIISCKTEMTKARTKDLLNRYVSE